ncbi:hypothetical protein K438DRAFT_1976465 [Mycena galopus ATCC 62051]|nr:hypothetical protein K438DRAFT_1976465 [Mycena galopus ATCC 62051]
MAHLAPPVCHFVPPSAPSPALPAQVKPHPRLLHLRGPSHPRSLGTPTRGAPTLGAHANPLPAHAPRARTPVAPPVARTPIACMQTRRARTPYGEAQARGAIARCMAWHVDRV